ncbi:putative protein Mb0912 [Mycobacterium bovis AF2122/97] [Rhizoctonia solani]|uniref:Jacalin-type lectin domain-containing protein n=1 Tax=Rhizoctonia solani TaxID=456999 RepID=A0A0K6FX50_9AGAM|nr:putative protein Mb0912 [Mycobacterium bovis AF2122/97] [Rhizoctonia solani]
MLHRWIHSLAASFLCFATVATLAKEEDEPRVEFSVMTMGVSGLPAKFDPCGPSEEKKTRVAMHIGKIMSEHKYGVVNVQEDFDTHATLYKYDQHPFRTENAGELESNSGLNTLSHYSWVDYSTIPWDSCHAQSETDIDCHAKKGFMVMRVRVNKGVYIDMINLDTNTGTGFYDYITRRSNIEQVVNFINTHSVGNAVIVFGNTNSLYTRAQDNIRLFTTATNLSDAWVQAIGGKAPTPGSDESITQCEVADKIFYRGSRAIDLESTGFFYDTTRFRSPEGNALTKHKPVRAKFGYAFKDGWMQSDLYGGPYGTRFNDLDSLPASPRLATIHLRGGNRLDGLTLSLVTGETFTHGGPGGTRYSLTLQPNEHVHTIELCWGERNGHMRNFYAMMTTNQKHMVQAGKSTRDCETWVVPEGYDVVGAYGRDGDEMDQLGFIYAQREDEKKE